jgi:hypothetical protein
MSKIKVRISEQNLTRCHTCLRHVTIDSSLSEEALLNIVCDFCQSILFTGIKTSDQYQTPFQSATHRSPIKHQRFGKRGSRLAAGLLSIGLAMVGCEDEESVEAGSVAGSVAGSAIAGISTENIGGIIAQPVYGVEAGFAVGGTSSAGTQAGTEMPAGTQSGTSVSLDMGVAEPEMGAALYGVEPAGIEAGINDMGLDIDMAAEVIPMPDYGVEPFPDMSTKK